MSRAALARPRRSLVLLACAVAPLSSLFAEGGEVPDLSRRTAFSVVPPRPQLPVFFMFAQYKDASALNVIVDYFTSADYIARLVAVAQPRLLSANGVPANHVFQIPTSQATVSAAASKLCQSGTPGLILYDIEHWEATPMSEQAEPGASINQCAAVVANAGCRSGVAYGIIPDGRFSGLPAQECTPDFSTSIYDGLGGSGGARPLDWSRVTFLGIQAQRMLDEIHPGNCHARNSPHAIASYVDFVSTISAHAYRQNPRIICVAQVSFRWTSPPVIIAAIRAIAPHVNGIYLAYPSGGRLCTPENLRTVLAAFRPSVSNGNHAAKP